MDRTSEQQSSGGRRVRLYRCEGVVLRRRDFGEADRLLTLMTDEYGKIRAIAKGTRRTKSRMGGHLEPFARTNLLIARGRNLDIVTQAQVVVPMSNLRQSESAILYASHWAELADQLMAEEQENRPAYLALIRALTSLDHQRDAALTSRIFEWAILAAAGFQPELFTCTGCGRRIEPGENGISFQSGGVLCPECHAREPQSSAISTDVLRILRVISRGDGEQLFGRSVGSATYGEVERILIDYLRSIVERDLHAYRILKGFDGFQEPVTP